MDPDATEVVAVDVEAMLHMELDASLAERKASRARLPSPRPAAGRPPKESIATIRAMRAAPRASSRMSAARASSSAIPRPPIHTLLPPCRLEEEDEDEVPTSFFDRASGRSSLPSVKGVGFPAPSFSAPRAPQPFHTVPAIPAAKRAVPPADESSPTPIQPVLAPTSRRDLRVPGVMESLAPMSMSAFPSVPPPPPAAKTLSAGSWFAIVFTMIFTLGSVAVMGVGVFKPSAIERARVGVVDAVKGKTPPPPADPAAAASPPPLPVEPAAVPPVLLAEPPAPTPDAGAPTK